MEYFNGFSTYLTPTGKIRLQTRSTRESHMGPRELVVQTEGHDKDKGEPEIKMKSGRNKLHSFPFLPSDCDICGEFFYLSLGSQATIGVVE